MTETKGPIGDVVDLAASFELTVVACSWKSDTYLFPGYLL